MAHKILQNPRKEPEAVQVVLIQGGSARQCQSVARRIQLSGQGGSDQRQ